MREGFWLSESGLLVFGTGGLGVKRRLLWIARDGKREEAVPEGLYQSLRLSPDGKEVALDAAAAVEDIWRLEFARGVKTKVTSDPRRDVVPAWSPDGRQLAYMSNRTGTFQLYRRDARGDGTEELLTEGPYPKYLTDWTRDGRFLVYYEITTKTKNDLWALPLSGDRKPVPLRTTAATEQHGVVSPDSKWLAYGSDQSGREEVYIQPFPSGSAWPVTSEGGNRPKWRSDGKELFFLNSFRNTIMSASVRITAAGVETSKPVPMVTLSSPLPALMSPYDVSPDGQRLLVLDPVDPTLALSPLAVVMNWDAGLKQ